MLNDLAVLRIPMMSTAGVSGVASLGDCGNEGTNGFGDAAGEVVVGGVGAGCTGEIAGDNWAKVVVEYKRETSSAIEKHKRDCFFIILVLVK